MWVCGFIFSNLSTVKHFKAKFGCPHVMLYEGRVLQSFLKPREGVKMESIISLLLLLLSSTVHGYVWLCMYGYVCMAMYVWLCMYGYVCMAMYVWLCMYGYVCMAMYVWLCMYGYVCMAMYVWLCMYVCMYVCMQL